MVNELYDLARTLESMEIKTESWHPGYKTLPKNAVCFRIWLLSDGTIHSIEALDTNLVARLRKFGNNQGTFPAFNISPLYRITDSEQMKELEFFIKNNSALNLEKVHQWCDSDNWIPKRMAQFDRCINIARELKKKIDKLTSGECNSMTSLLEVAQGLTAEKFKVDLTRWILEKLKLKEDVEMTLSLLFQKGNTIKDSSLSIVLDLYNWQQFGYPVASEHMTKWMNSILIKSENSNALIELREEADAFGMQFENEKKMPGVALPILGEVILRSMFGEQYCQHRYGQYDGNSYPISKKNQREAKGALEWIAKSHNENVTWVRVGGKELVFAYPSRIPEKPLAYVSIFGNNVGSGEKKASFEKVAERFAKTFKGVSKEAKPDTIQIFSIQKMDKSRTKVIFTRNITPEHMIYAAKKWQRGCENIPENMNWIGSQAPFPLQIADIANNVWNQSGEVVAKGKVNRIKYCQGIELLLDVEPYSLSRYLLSVLVPNSFCLIKFAGDFTNGGWRRDSKLKQFSWDRNWRLRASLGLFYSTTALLLYKCGYKKEGYMKDTAYLMGQMMKISDELHSYYCYIVRDGQIPPQLAGNSMFSLASDAPVQALSQLGKRMNPYVSWAKQYRTKDIKDSEKEKKGSWRAGWYLKLYEETSDQLHLKLNDSHIRFNDFDKAQLFIGYLASFPQKDRMKNNETIENNMNQIEGGISNE